MKFCATVGELKQALAEADDNARIISHELTDVIVVPQDNGAVLIAGAKPRQASKAA